ncbi:hypothetical protein A2773_05810 [Candidatus Gottesmanbacteria bacterium RIFCSPHIGHO2_01_FULL_39_10]|uniref:Phage holin family protein n=1 Tax=Candidatus Gottesmanbacteria bacterium RIFCSPHIGHO2_01_FULL_39_10 TaxID=1798375 RepID=A0A1F5ZLK0_9BACT|nr:MAG: hypothetical protein A2773_05810 [Candidatus Gottesmanbacteria bacterium RIFCSPHIGHO2_01_FULL_39_10]
MKTILRTYVYSLFALWLTAIFIPSFKILGGIESIFYVAAVFSFLHILVRPILKIILLPLNLITFGLFSWVINVALLFLLMRLTPYIQIAAWKFPGISIFNIVLSPMQLVLWQTFIVTSLIIGIIVNLLLWLAK